MTRHARRALRPLPRLVAALMVSVAFALGVARPTPAAPAAQPAVVDLILATTTSTQDSGLLDVLVPSFERESGYKVKTIAVGTGQAMALGERGEADVLLVHAPASERKWMDAGHGIDRRLVMYNDFVVIGPSGDPAGVSGSPVAEDVMRKIAGSGSLWISRGDNSGTHQLELALWKNAGIDPRGQSWYQEVGQGMGQTLTVANEKQGYTLTDRGTYLARKRTLELPILAERYQSFLNVYHVMVVNPAKGAHINVEGAQAFAAYVIAPAVQEQIATFGLDKFGEPLFFPAATKTDEELGV